MRFVWIWKTQTLYPQSGYKTRLNQYGFIRKSLHENFDIAISFLPPTHPVTSTSSFACTCTLTSVLATFLPPVYIPGCTTSTIDSYDYPFFTTDIPSLELELSVGNAAIETPVIHGRLSKHGKKLNPNHLVASIIQNGYILKWIQDKPPPAMWHKYNPNVCEHPDLFTSKLNAVLALGAIEEKPIMRKDLLFSMGIPWKIWATQTF